MTVRNCKEKYQNRQENSPWQPIAKQNPSNMESQGNSTSLDCVNCVIRKENETTDVRVAANSAIEEEDGGGGGRRPRSPVAISAEGVG